MRHPRSTAGSSAPRLPILAGAIPSRSCLVSSPVPFESRNRRAVRRMALARGRDARTFPYTGQTNTVFDLRIVLRDSFATESRRMSCSRAPRGEQRRASKGGSVTISSVLAVPAEAAGAIAAHSAAWLGADGPCMRGQPLFWRDGASGR